MIKEAADEPPRAYVPFHPAVKSRQPHELPSAAYLMQR